ncbi:hypothetical protein bcere0020_54070 [Bacillus cereus Rock3-29]|uniref:hypothetical protein n=1 Tax=Bacillus toyonensis TaxID=155322 RepID=UPI0001A0B6CC|nr:hypothetical protein [Bacillus toyonensis]EEL37226.1 hypothetical protein bcere0020_54070 [Bacillus cereus Rock3-29]PHD38230.1 hypothetical protein COF48_00280 [Bacillus toyonensis]
MKNLDKITQDVKTVIDGSKPNLGLKRLIVSLKDYAGTLKTPQERAQLFFLIATILDWEEEEFEETISRISRVMIQNELGIDLNKVIDAITKSEKNTTH